MQTEAVNSQKRTGTVLFADVAGFTAFAERIGEEAAFEMIRDVSARMQTAIHDHSGTVGEFRGDGIMALFSVTKGIEDGPLRACQAALQIQHGIAGAEAEMLHTYGAAPRVRIGVHCGPLVVGDVSGGDKAHVTIIGDTANTASRLESMAEPGQIVISRDIHALVEGQIDVTDLGKRQMKGKSRPMHVFALEAVNKDLSRFEAALSRLETEMSAATKSRLIEAPIEVPPATEDATCEGLSPRLAALRGDVPKVAAQRTKTGRAARPAYNDPNPD